MYAKERYTVNAYGAEEKAFATLYNKALETAAKLGDVDNLTFVAHGLSNDGWLERAFGHDKVRELKSTGLSIKGGTAKARFRSLKNYKPEGREIIVTLGLRSDDILSLEDNNNIIALFALPWSGDDADKWAKMMGAFNISTGEASMPYPAPDCVVTKALRDLTGLINRSTGLNHSSDDDLAKTYLRALNKYGYSLNIEEIETYLIRDLNWMKKHADQVIEIIRKINAGKSFKGGAKTHLKSHVDLWKSQCKESK